ncbi:uncharacterized protein LOC123532859 [Mercenaria mercenaria]|uniref:uncharacterized protein LOC123532859 n=1 Tax=Mercenaria mercenaria TaxID=6596 RepID=UPI00234E9B83|nr:uncharacterized protein LOC123532859 [Mercenaria mercenaria]
MSYEDFYTDWLWKIFVITDESDAAEEYARTIVSLLDTLKNPPDVETNSLHGKTLSEKCRKILFILDESNRTGEENKLLHKWLRSLAIDPGRSNKYMVLRVNSNEDEGFAEPLEGLAESQVIQVNGIIDVYTWWPRVIRFLCKTRNWGNSAYILLHAGFGHDITDVSKMIENIKEIEEQKKILEVMLGPFGPRNLHKVKWHDDAVASVGSFPGHVRQRRSSTNLGYQDMNGLPNDYTSQRESNLATEIRRNAVVLDEKKYRIDPTVAKYVYDDPVTPSWKDDKRFASVVPLFIILKPDITVAEKCCLTDYAREFPKTHFLCISEESPSNYMKLLSSNVYGRRELMEFVFNLLKELKNKQGTDSPKVPHFLRRKVYWIRI